MEDPLIDTTNNEVIFEDGQNTIGKLIYLQLSLRNIFKIINFVLRLRFSLCEKI